MVDFSLSISMAFSEAQMPPISGLGLAAIRSRLCRFFPLLSVFCFSIPFPSFLLLACVGTALSTGSPAAHPQ